MTDKISEKDYREFKQECEQEMQRTEPRLISDAGQSNNKSEYLTQSVDNLSMQKVCIWVWIVWEKGELLVQCSQKNSFLMETNFEPVD